MKNFTDQPKIGEPAFPDLTKILEYCKIFFASGHGSIKDVVLLSNLEIEMVDEKYFLHLNGKNHLIESRKGLDHDEIQLNLNDIIKIIKKNKPKDAFHMLGMTMFDLFKEKRDLFLSGWNQAGARTGLFTFSRYDPFYLQRAKDKYYHTSLTNFRKNAKQNVKERIKLILMRSIKTLTYIIEFI
jgi:hypothetical protein